MIWGWEVGKKDKDVEGKAGNLGGHPGLRTKETSEKFPANSMSSRHLKSVMCDIQFQVIP